MEYSLQVTKRAYTYYIEHLCRYGYYIGDKLNPVYKNHNAFWLITMCNTMCEEYDPNYWDYNDKLTLEDCGYESK